MLDLDGLKQAQAVAEIVTRELRGKLLTPLLLTDAEAGALLSVGADAIRAMAERGELERIPVGEKGKRITRSSIDRYIQR